MSNQTKQTMAVVDRLDRISSVFSQACSILLILSGLFYVALVSHADYPLNRLVGSLLMVQGASSCFFNHTASIRWNSTTTTSTSTDPATTASTGLLGLCVLLLGGGCSATTTTTTTTSIVSSTLPPLLGALIALCSCVSLMMRVWPRVNDDNNNTSLFVPSNHPPRTRQNSMENDDNSMREPLLHETNDRSVDDDLESGSRETDPDDNNAEPLREEEENNNNNTENEEEEESGRLQGTRRLLQLAKPQVRYLYLGCLVLLVRLPFSLAMPHFVSQTLGALAKGHFEAAQTQVLHLLLAGTIDAALDFWGFFLFGYANQRIVKTLRIDLFRKLLGFEVSFFDTHTSGELSSRLNADCSEMAGDLTWFFRFSIESVVRITGIASYMLVQSPTLGGCALLIVPCVAGINKLYGDWLRRNSTKVQDALADANAVAQEVLSNVRTVIAFAAEQHETQQYQSKIEVSYLLNVKQLFMTAVYYMAVSTFLINTIVQGALLWIGILLIERGTLAPEVLLAFMLYQSQLQNETLSLMNSYTSLIKSSGAGRKVFALLDRRPPPPGLGDQATMEYPMEPQGGGAASTENTAQAAVEVAFGTDTANDNDDPSARSPYNVQLEQVTFRYPTRRDNIVLNEINLEIPKGKTVALVGKSGCGKSTIVNLLQRFHDPTKGRILINGVNLRQLDLLNHRRHIGAVTQFPTLFAGTLLDNIKYGCRHNIPDEQVHDAAKLANAESFIRDFPDGYDTLVGEGGVMLSGGQKQRIAIARAVVLQPSLLLLDEATSALDSESETAVQKALDDLLATNKEMTTLVIAHRLRTVQNADKIVVLKDGKVAESGTHDQLMEKKAIYYEMVAQAVGTGVLPES